ncbi:MAG: gamma-glutamyl-gamma-aminobutyrate hydrolase family protein [Planctomycetes bacterium]|nr:gamma-glutamyl-gamma-aminobutyrate hydrolase family protein [Planctomycetota bacterium]
MSQSLPIIGITPDVAEVNGRVRIDVGLAYSQAVERAGGLPVVLAPQVALIPAYLSLCNGFVFTGGDDPRTEPFGVPTHREAKPLHPQRQEFETALLRAIDSAPHRPVLGICLGMQMMSLCAGGKLNQHLPDTLPTHRLHWGEEHPVVALPNAGPLALAGKVQSKHRQAVEDPGRLAPIARSEDGVLEAVRDIARPFYLGVQWHPERTRDESVGQRLFDELVSAARRG